MVEKGLIYRDFRPVYYSPSSRSALAEAELVYMDDHVSRSVFVTFTLHTGDAAVGCMSERLKRLVEEEHREGKEVKVMVWTTTPWTLTANMVSWLRH
jgi:isoleucyl-tRNA synthetase